MTQRGEPDLAALWKEQVDPAEQAKLQALGAQIRGKARRRRLFDYAATLLAAGMIVVSMAMPMRPFHKFVIAVSIAMVIWNTFWRQRVAAAALAVKDGEPGAFLAAAIRHARAEVRLSAIGLILGMPVFTLWLIQILIGSGAGDFGLHVPYLGAATFVLIIALIYVVSVPAHRRLRARLARLETMAREYEEEHSRDLEKAE